MSDAQGGDGGSRDVVVPMPLYKTVTVFSTLLAVLGVVGGFVLLDAAVMAGGIVRFVVNAVLSVFSLQVDPAVWGRLQPVFAVLGLAAIALGAVVYVVGSRFRAEGMGEDGPDETAGEDAETTDAEAVTDAATDATTDHATDTATDTTTDATTDATTDTTTDAH